MSAKHVETVVESGTERFIPLNKLKKSPKNARKTPHSQASIEAYAASIAAKGILQNLVAEPELDTDGAATGFYFVTIGEGRRLAQLLRVKRKEIKKTEPIRCIIDTANDPHEISLDENVTRENMHPADQFEAFKKLAEERGFGAEEIAARFGVTPHVVRQRLRLAAVSPKLMQVYRDGGLTLEQLMAFAITEGHARQEAVYDRLSYNRDASTIRRLLTETHVAATDRRAVFVGVEAYTEAGGTILRDLFSEDRGGYFEDVALLDLLVTAKLSREADALREAEGWKWTEAHLDFPHAHGMRRTYPHPMELSVEDQADLEAARCEVDQLAEWNQTADELPDHVDARFCELEADIERLEAKRQAYDPDDIARGGAFVILNHDGMVRIERGFIHPEDEKPQPEAEHAGEASVVGDTEGGDSQAPQDENGEGESATDEEDDDRPLFDSLVRDLTAHRTLGLRLNLSEQPEVAVVVATYALAAQIFYLGATRMLSASSRSRRTWPRTRTVSRTLRPGRRGRISAWAAVEPIAAGEAYNVANGDLFRWENLWPALGKHFGLEIGPPMSIRLVDHMRDKADLWAALARRHALATPDYGQAIAWGFGDFVFHTGYDVVFDLTKLRLHGCHEIRPTEDGLIEKLDQLQAARMIPPLRGLSIGLQILQAE